MGYAAKIKTYLIQFQEGHEYHGVEARLSGMPYGEWEVAAGLDGGGGDTDGKTSVQRFVEHLVEWNLDDPISGEPLPPTMESVKKLDKDLVAALNNAYVNTLIGVHDGDPLAGSSPAGEQSPEVSAIPMEALSPSLAS